jgi:gag-polypeptide of LTR copia-type
VKLEKQFRELCLKKGQDPEIWITDLEDLRVRLEAMGSSKSENQFMIHILNNLTSDYEIQLALMEKRVGDMEKPLTIEEIRGEVSLLFERMNMKSSNNKEGDNFEDTAFLPDSLKENVAIAVKSGTNCSNARIEDLSMAEITETQVAVIFACIVLSLAMIGRIVSSSRRRIHDPTMPVQIMVTLTNQSLTHKM